MIPQEAVTFATTIISASLVTGSIVWGFSAWISGKLTNIYNRIEKAQETILTKLEYHEKHDDQRFASMNNELWTIKIRNASKDGHFEVKAPNA